MSNFIWTLDWENWAEGCTQCVIRQWITEASLVKTFVGIPLVTPTVIPIPFSLPTFKTGYSTRIARKLPRDCCCWTDEFHNIPINFFCAPPPSLPAHVHISTDVAADATLTETKITITIIMNGGVAGCPHFPAPCEAMQCVKLLDNRGGGAATRRRVCWLQKEKKIKNKQLSSFYHAFSCSKELVISVVLLKRRDVT